MKTFKSLRNFANNYVNNQEAKPGPQKQLSEHRIGDADFI